MIWIPCWIHKYYLFSSAERDEAWSDVWSDLSRGRAKLYIVLSVLFPNEKKQTDKNKKVNRNFSGIIIIISFLGFDLSSGLFVVLGTAGRSARMCCTIPIYSGARVESIQHFSLPISAWWFYKSFVHRHFLFRCVYRDGNGILYFFTSFHLLVCIFLRLSYCYDYCH